MALSVACRWSTMADRQLSCRLLQLSCQWCAAGIMAGAGVARLPSPSRPPPRPLFLLGTGHHPFTLHDGGARLHHGFYLTKDCSLGGTLHARHPSSPRHQIIEDGKEGTSLHLLTVLTFGFLQGWAHRKDNRWRFALVHGGLCLTLYAMFWGSADNRTLMAIAYKGHSSHEAVTAGKKTVYPDYEFQLSQMKVTTYPNGTPQSIEASLVIDDRPVSLRVGKPYPVKWDEDVYLHSYDRA